MHHTLFAVLAVVSAPYWLVVAFSVAKVILRVPLVEKLTPRTPHRWPRVSVIIPACNEALAIEAALRSRVAEGYPDAEYIVVDDRSTDGTGEIIEALAREDGRIVPVHVSELPVGWLGKVHAMNVALGRATGEFILFSDADVHHEPGTLERVIAHCQENGIDHVSVFPSVWSSTFPLDVLMNTVLRAFAVASRAWKVADPTSRVSLGGGNFNLVRRSALERAGGLEPLKLEVLDDAGLGQTLKWSGAKQVVLNARGFVGLWFYRSVREAVGGMEKNGFAAIGRYSVARCALAMIGLAVAELGAFAALAGGGGWVRILAAITVAVALGAQLAIGKWLGRPALPTLFAPIGTIVLAFAALRSMVLALVRGGIVWRGTLYPLAALRRGMRYVHA